MFWALGHSEFRLARPQSRRHLRFYYAIIKYWDTMSSMLIAVFCYLTILLTAVIYLLLGFIGSINEKGDEIREGLKQSWTVCHTQSRSKVERGVVRRRIRELPRLRFAVTAFWGTRLSPITKYSKCAVLLMIVE